MEYSYPLLRDNGKSGVIIRDVLGVVDGGRIKCVEYEENNL